MMSDHDSERLGKIEKEQIRTNMLLSNLSENIREQNERSEKHDQLVDETLFNTERGHNIRVDRLEQNASQQKWWLRSLALGIIALLGRLAHDIFARSN
tara:strand:- start:755 stop:1048 length:294 start_codon:yes stop_codon:yes gene_type:complete